MKDMVKVTCYGQTQMMERKAAINEFFEGMMCCEGSEQERYSIIYCQLMEGRNEVSDELY